MSSEFLEGELCGVRACLSVLEHEPGISNEDLLGRLRNIGFFGNHRLYVNQDMGVIFKKIKGYRDDLYKIQYSYWK